MEKMITVKAYDGSMVTINEKDLQSFNITQEKIKKNVEEGKSIDEIFNLIKEGKL